LSEKKRDVFPGMIAGKDLQQSCLGYVGL